MRDNSPISILVPVYKVEKYLPRCIESVLSQDFTDWELVLVDDGSPDRCPQICDEYAQKDERIRVVHKENEGVYIARKIAINMAQGEYLVFVDADDYLPNNALSILYTKAMEGFDIVKGINIRFRNNGKKIEEIPKNRKSQVYDKEEYLKAVIKYDIPPYLWGGIYNRRLFTIELLDSITPLPVGEDWLMNMALWKSSPKYAFINQIVYYYYINDESVMQTKVLSHVYIDAIKEQMYLISKDSDLEILFLIETNRILAHAKALFTPELPWDEEQYKKIRLYNKKYKKEFVNASSRRFLRWVDNVVIYRVYVELYKFLFKYKRQKGHSRKVI